MPKQFEFPPSKRIKKRQDFTRIQSSGKKLYSRHFVAAISDPKESTVEPTESRLGVTVTKKVDKRAVGRNYLKRRIKEVFRLNQHKLKKPIDLVIIARKGAVDLSFQEVAEELCQLLKKGRWCKFAKRHSRTAR
jgi:ribonuclease P protein component